MGRDTNIEKALAVDGYMQGSELLWLAEQAATHERIVEVGSLRGRSTRAIADNTPGFVLAVDDWHGPREVDLVPQIRNGLFNDFLNNCGDLVDRGKIKILKTDHSKVECDFQPDMVFIDGSHEYADVKRDIEFWRSKLAPGGLLCGHDANSMQVQAAIVDTIGEVVKVPNTEIWIEPKEIKKQSNSVTAITGLVVGLPFAGHPVVPEWGMSLAMISYPMNTNVSFSALKGKPVGEARNEIVEHALTIHAKYIFFLDDDVAPPHFAVRRLIYLLEQSDDNFMVAGGIYCAKWEPTEPIVYRGDGQGAFWKWKAGEAFECSSIGTGCMMIRAEVFKHLEKPWFKTVDDMPELNSDVTRVQVTDDLYFCEKVRRAGFKIVADGSILCVHWDWQTGKHYVLPPDSYPLRAN